MRMLKLGRTAVLVTAALAFVALGCASDTSPSKDLFGTGPVRDEETGGESSTDTNVPPEQSGGETNDTGGRASGGARATGGRASGGQASGGQASGGTAPTQGGSNTVVTSGGQTSGGTSASGGRTTGGSSARGGSATGGSATGGSATGGSSPSNCPTAEEDQFSFFLISHEAVQRESGSTDGFGGDLGGLEGADGICQRVAEYVSACQSSKVWHAFLSTSTVDAIDRVGTGPWYDRNGYLLANGLTDLVGDRPTNANAIIKNDFPNEYGVPNHAPDGGTQVDNHEILTGTGTNGRKYTQSTSPGMTGSATSCGDGTWTIEAATCWGWTTSEAKGCPRVGHSWPRQGSGTNWMSCWNEGGCAPGGNLTDSVAGGGLDGTRRVGSAGGYGGWYCFAVIPTP